MLYLRCLNVWKRWKRGCGVKWRREKEGEGWGLKKWWGVCLLLHITTFSFLLRTTFFSLTKVVLSFSLLGSTLLSYKQCAKIFKYEKRNNPRAKTQHQVFVAKTNCTTHCGLWKITPRTTSLCWAVVAYGNAVRRLVGVQWSKSNILSNKSVEDVPTTHCRPTWKTIVVQKEQQRTKYYVLSEENWTS